MQVCKLKYESIWVAVNRSYFEAKHGRVGLALKRLQEMAQEFPRDAHVAYAQGTIRRDYLGQGDISRSLFKEAYDLSTTKESKQTRWFALCNIIGLAENEEKYRFWVNRAFREQGRKKAECKGFEKILNYLDVGYPYAAILMNESLVHFKKQEYGLAAALIDVALLTGSPELNELGTRHNRALYLRFLDSEAQNQRNSSGESFPPDERLALQEAVTEINKCLALDQYDATLWNYKSAWSTLLGQYNESISAANKAIELRPHNYSRPHLNKAQALWALNQEHKALASAREALRQVQAHGQPAIDAEKALALINRLSKTPSTPTFDDLKSVIHRLIKVALETSEEEFSQNKTGATLKTVVERLFKHIFLLQKKPLAEFLPIITELLSDFTPETMYRVNLQIAQSDKNATIYCLATASYLATFSKGVLQRDATRYLCLTTLAFNDRKAIQDFYRKVILKTVSKNEMKKLDNLMRKEMTRINPLFSQLIADQKTVDEQGYAQVTRNIKAAQKKIVSCEECGCRMQKIEGGKSAR